MIEIIKGLWLVAFIIWLYYIGVFVEADRFLCQSREIIAFSRIFLWAHMLDEVE